MPSSSDHGPTPLRPSCVSRPVRAGASVLEKNVHGQAAVENVQLADEATCVPSLAAAPVPTLAVTATPPGSSDVGVAVAVLVAELYVTAAGTAPEGPARVNVELFSVAGSMSRENVAFTAPLRGKKPA